MKILIFLLQMNVGIALILLGGGIIKNDWRKDISEKKIFMIRLILVFLGIITCVVKIIQFLLLHH